MSTKARFGRLVTAAAGAVLALATVLSPPARAATESMTVNLSAATGPSTGVGQGFLYGINQDGTQPPDQYLQPLQPNAYRAGGHVTRGWIGDGYKYGSGTQTDVGTVIAQAKRLAPYNPEFQVLVTDLYGLDGGQPSNTVYPCDNGDCSNWVSFIDATVGALQASGLKFAYDIDNEPDISVFWTRGVNSAQYFQMWDTAYREIRRIAPDAKIVGPSFAFTPLANRGEWQTWLAHVKTAGTVPDEITNHDEGDVDDPVAVSQALNSALDSAGIARRPLSANEYQPADRQTAGVTAWYLARFAQSGYTNAMRGNWVCCLIPNLTGIVAVNGSSFAATGNWWTFRTYADLTGSLVSTSGQVGSTAISAAEDSARKRAVAILGDSSGYTGSASVTFNGLSSVPWLTNNGSVHVTVYRIPDQSPLTARQVVLDQDLSTGGGSVTVPVTFQASHDAFGIYLTPASGGGSGGSFPTGYHPLVVGNNGLCLDVYGNSSASGAAIDQWSCNGQSNQLFQFVPGLNGYGELQAQSSGQVVGVSGGSTAQGTPDIVQQARSGAASTMWKPVAQSDGSWSFQNSGSGLCLDVYGAGSNQGQQLDQWPCKNAAGSNQDFTPR
ncbi:RICIN domain-containing protein [Actinoallomurus rhizosphaericola]|uniref:RICIN domain-containing protein n=1 Tax=Actinoallomurus rhizosphaericola TaxID=2952536 RepID=UPI00209227C2|nr:RICIN domain-containing protein [Actinoallomurus rhizosphaericola]MCO5995626.1 RICIN domain-containing protein [Actinoallomurus rhizosphaericola]